MNKIFNNIIEVMSKNNTFKLVIFLAMIPNIALASDFSGLALYLIVFFWGVSVASYFLVKYFTKNVSNKVLRDLLRILSVTVFISPTSVDGSPYVLSPVVAFTAGNSFEILMALVSITIFTVLIYIIKKANIFDE